MRKIIYAYIAVWIAVILLSPNPPAVWATKPTVTVTGGTSSTTTTRYRIYSASFTTVGGVKDTAFVLDPDGAAFNIDGIGYTDSLVTLEFTTNFAESKKDSVKFGVMWDVATLASPTINQFSIAQHDSLTLKSKWPGGVAKFYVRRYAGNATKMRVRIYELGTVGVSPQAIVARLLIPRR